MPRRANLRGIVALTIGGAALGLVSMGLKDAAPFLFFGTESEVAEREAGELLVNLGAVLSILAGVAILDRHVWRGVVVAAAGGIPAALLLSPLDQSAIPGAAYVVLASAAAAVLIAGSGLRFDVVPLVFAVPVMWAAAAVLFVYAAGPIVGGVGALMSPMIFAATRMLALR